MVECEENRELFNMKDIEIGKEKKIVVVLSESRDLKDICEEMILREKIDESNYGKTFVIIHNVMLNGKFTYCLGNGWSLIYRNKTYTIHDILYSE